MGTALKHHPQFCGSNCCKTLWRTPSYSRKLLASHRSRSPLRLALVAGGGAWRLPPWGRITMAFRYRFLCVTCHCHLRSLEECNFCQVLCRPGYCRREHEQACAQRAQEQDQAQLSLSQVRSRFPLPHEARQQEFWTLLRRFLSSQRLKTPRP